LFNFVINMTVIAASAVALHHACSSSKTL